MNTESVVALWGSTFFALGFMALSMPTHFKNVFGILPRPIQTQGFSLSGWMILAASLILALAHWNGGVTLVAWVALLSFNGCLVTLILCYGPKRRSAS
jgi:hypothetical protein